MEQNKQKSLWKNNDFLILWSGQTISGLGTTISQIAYPLLILYLTNSPLQAGIGASLSALPTFIFGLFAGAFIDRLNRKKVMIICDLGRTFIMVSIPIAAFIGYLTVQQIYLVAFLEGTFGVFYSVANIAALPQIVGKEKLIEALSQNSASGSSVSLIGPAIGGFLYQAIGKTVPYLVDSISYAVSTISLLFIKTQFQEERLIEKKDLRKEIHEGIVWLWHHPIIRIITILTAGGALVGSGQNLVIILLAKNLHAGSTAIGIIFSIGAVGNLLGALMVVHIKKRIRMLKVIIGARWLMAGILPFYLFAPNIIMIGIITALYFYIGPIYGILLAGYRISIIPDVLQGRVTSIYQMITLGGYSLGGIIGGLLLQIVGTSITIIFFSTFLFILAILASLKLRKLEVNEQ